MSDSKIEVSDSGVRIIEMLIPRRDVADFLRKLPSGDYEAAVIRALEVGVFCLERASTSQDLDFVRRQVESLMRDLQIVVGNIPGETQKAISEKIGTGEGQVLAPVKAIVETAGRVAEQRIGEVRKLLSEEIDPTKETTTLGRTLRALTDLFDPRRKDSVQASIEAAVAAVAGEDGRLAATVKQVVEQSVKPLSDRVNDLAKEVRGREAAAEALEQTTAKGSTFEDVTVGRVQSWTGSSGHEVHHVGADSKPGDIVVQMAATEGFANPLVVVIECRDRGRGMGRKQIAECLEAAMSERQASAAVYLSRDLAGLGKELGDWAEGAGPQGPWLACTADHLITALRFLIVQRRLEEIRASRPEVDAFALQAQIRRIRTSLDRIKTINSRATDVHFAEQAIRDEATALREEIRGCLLDMEEAMRTKTAEAVGSADAA